MRRILASLVFAALAAASGIAAAGTHVGFGISVGIPAPVYSAPPPLVYYPSPAYVPPPAVYVALPPVHYVPAPVYYGPPVVHRRWHHHHHRHYRHW